MGIDLRGIKNIWNELVQLSEKMNFRFGLNNTISATESFSSCEKINIFPYLKISSVFQL